MTSTPLSKQELLERKKAVLTKFYGGERKAYYHDFRLSDGVCIHCSTFIGDAMNGPAPRMCKVITPDEVALFRPEEI